MTLELETWVQLLKPMVSHHNAKSYFFSIDEKPILQLPSWNDINRSNFNIYLTLFWVMCQLYILMSFNVMCKHMYAHWSNPDIFYPLLPPSCIRHVSHFWDKMPGRKKPRAIFWLMASEGSVHHGGGAMVASVWGSGPNWICIFPASMPVCLIQHHCSPQVTISGGGFL